MKITLAGEFHCDHHRGAARTFMKIAEQLWEWGEKEVERLKAEADDVPRVENSHHRRLRRPAV